MVTLRKLLGDRSEVYYECMYTKHKTQKRKVWHDGFLSLHVASRKLVLYEDQPPEGLHYLMPRMHCSIWFLLLMVQWTVWIRRESAG
jgi:hypothetical protein